MRVISLYTGAGGLDIGLESAGFSIGACVENDATCRETLAVNRPDWQLIEPGDVHAITPREIVSAAGGEGGIALLAGGPPCQPFSKSGQWQNGSTGRMNDPRAKTVEAFLDVVEAALPEAMLLENVPGFAASANGESEDRGPLALVRRRLAAINRSHGTRYAAQLVSLDAADYGVPQHRKRVFVIASRAGRTFDLPTPTHGPESDRRYATAWDAIGDLDGDPVEPTQNLRGRWADLVPSIPEGHNYQFHTPKGDGEPLFGWRTRYWSFLLKLAKNRPSWTIQAQAGPATGPIHWKNRQLSLMELARLQCFPDSWQFVGKPNDVKRQIGNAVPPPIGELLGREIQTQFFDADPFTEPLAIPIPRSDCPDAEPVLAVPSKYLALRGSHDDHPGSGLGPGALARATATN